MADQTFQYTIGYYKKRPYTLVIRPDPGNIENTEDVENKLKVSLNIHFREEGEQHEIARIDNSHDHMHIHRFYTAQKEDTEEINMDYWEAMNYIQNNWKRFAKLYDKNHL